jgi:hypothetical protein
MPLYLQSAMNQRACPTPYPSIVFTFKLAIEFTKEFRGASQGMSNSTCVDYQDDLLMYVQMESFFIGFSNQNNMFL